MITLDSRQFKKDMKNIMEYSFGFLEGVESGKKIFLNNMGKAVVERLKEFIDSYARTDPQMLHHIYEWYQVGSSNARLFDIDFTVSGVGLTFYTSFTQSQSIKEGSNTPFYNKATIMEKGKPLTIRPKKSPVLVFEDGGETVFTRNPVKVYNPGGDEVQGAFEEVFDIFMTQYFKQSFIKTSGLYDYIKYPKVFKTNMKSGKRGGRPVGKSTGFKWIANAVIA